MTFHVVIQAPAKLDIDAAFIYLAQRSMPAAERWLDGLENAIRSLAMMPRRCGIAPESREFPEEIRQLIYGRRGARYRVRSLCAGARFEYSTCGTGRADR